MPKVVPPCIEEEGEEEEEEEKAPVLCSRSLRNRGPVILEEGELADEPIIAEEVERPEVDLVGREGFEISRVLTQPGPSSAHGKWWRCWVSQCVDAHLVGCRSQPY